MDVRLLGPLEVRLGDRPIELGPRKQRAVLAMLALDPGRTVSADRLAEGLWGDEPPASGAKMVQLYVSHLRRALEGNGASIVTHGRGYELLLADGDVDATRAAADRRIPCARGARALARRPARGPGRRAVRGGRDPPPRGAAPARGGVRDRRRPRGRPARRGDRRARAARRRAPAARAPARAAHARAVSRRPPVGGAGGLPGGAYRTGRADRRRAGRRAATPARAGARPRPGARPPRGRRGRAGDPTAAVADARARAAHRRGRPDPRRHHRLRHHPSPRPRRAARHRRELRRADRSRQRAHHQADPGWQEPDGDHGRGGSTWVASAGDGTVMRIDRKHDQPVSITVGGAPAALAFAGGSLWVADSESRDVVQVDPGANKVLGQSRSGTRRVRWRSHPARCGSPRASTAALRRSTSAAAAPDRRSAWERTRARSPPAPARCGWPARRRRR